MRDMTGNCPPGNGDNGDCTQDEVDEYGACGPAMCDAEYKACLGNDYKSGAIGGSCETYMKCLRACDCGDSACSQACGAPAGDCQSCLLTLGSCTQSKCPVPACFTSGGTAGTGGTDTKTCADLTACCAGKSGDDKSTCDSLVNASQGMDIACNAYYMAAGC